MRVALIQLDIAWHDERSNIERVRQMIASGGEADLYVLPEMWSSGFTIEGAEVAATERESLSLAFMLEVARERQCAVVGTLVVWDAEGTLRNRMYFVTAEGILARYDKRHLFRIGGETKRYAAGSERVVAEWRGVRFLLQTCYDIRFPAFSRNRLCEDGRAEYDVAIYVASFPASRAAAWRTLAAARAVENQAYCVAVNRTGDDIYCHYDGGSIIFDAESNVVAECSRDEQMLVAELDMATLHEFRRRFPTLRDGDAFELYLN